MEFQAMESMNDSQAFLTSTSDNPYVADLDQLVASRLGTTSEGDIDYEQLERDAIGFDGPVSERESTI